MVGVEPVATIKKVELHVIGTPPAREHYLIVSEVHRAVLGDVSDTPVEVKFDKYCPAWADDEQETALVYEVWQA